MFFHAENVEQLNYLIRETEKQLEGNDNMHAHLSEMGGSLKCYLQSFD